MKTILLAALALWQVEAAGAPLWRTPVFLELPHGWRVERLSSGDTQAFSLARGGRSIVFDYGPEQYLQKRPTCRSEEVAAAEDLRALPCFEERAESTFLSVEDPENPRWRLVISTRPDQLLGADFHAIRQSLRFVGKPERVRLIAVAKSKRKAVIVDETGWPRTVRKGERILRDYGVVREIHADAIVVEQSVMDAAGDYEAKRRTLLLSKWENFCIFSIKICCALKMFCMKI